MSHGAPDDPFGWKEYEASVQGIFEKLKTGGDEIVEYCKLPLRHRVHAPRDFKNGGSFRGGRTGRYINVDVSFWFDDPETRETVPVIVECKYHADPVSVVHLGKFAYDLLDIREHPQTRRAIGLFFARSGFQSGAKKIATAEEIAIAWFDPMKEGTTYGGFMTEDAIVPWSPAKPDQDGFAGELYLSGSRHPFYFVSPASLLHILASFHVGGEG